MTYNKSDTPYYKQAEYLQSATHELIRVARNDLESLQIKENSSFLDVEIDPEIFTYQAAEERLPRFDSMMSLDTIQDKHIIIEETTSVHEIDIMNDSGDETTTSVIDIMNDSGDENDTQQKEAVENCSIQASIQTEQVSTDDHDTQITTEDIQIAVEQAVEVKEPMKPIVEHERTTNDYKRVTRRKRRVSPPPEETIRKKAKLSRATTMNRISLRSTSISTPPVAEKKKVLREAPSSLNKNVPSPPITRAASSPLRKIAPLPSKTASSSPSKKATPSPSKTASSPASKTVSSSTSKREPSRRAANEQPAKLQYIHGEIVWARVPSFPSHPAKVNN
jgi:hypothetical protein